MLYVLILASRTRTMNDFGFVALDFDYVYAEDSGTYSCKATNALGSAVTSATLDVKCKSKTLHKYTVAFRNFCKSPLTKEVGTI